MDKLVDVAVIGGGAVGCAIVRELSKYRMKAAVFEKDSDVACGTSGRNSAVVHAGFNNKPNSLMAKFCVEGNTNFCNYADELDIPYKKTGKLLVAFNDDDMNTLETLYNQGQGNGCKGLMMLTKSQLKDKAPYVNGIGAMLSSNTAIINPFLYTVALAENAKNNGAEFFFGYELTGVTKESHENNDSFKLKFNGETKSTVTARYVINSAGIYADKVSALFGVDDYHIYPCRGQYLILDKRVSDTIDIPVYPAPHKGIGGLGIHVTPTSDGNIILGPSAEYIDSQDDYECTQDVISKLLVEAKQLIPGVIRREDVIGQYTGIRAKQAPKSDGGFRDFVIRSEDNEPHLINLIGIESPGLTASIPIAQYVCDILKEYEHLEKNTDFNGQRVAPIRFRELSDEQKEKMIKQDPDYGEIVCRCEKVTKAEVKQAINSIDMLTETSGNATIAAIKNRTRCMTGRCQGGVCLANITDILINEYGYKPEDIKHRDNGSYYYDGRVK